MMVRGPRLALVLLALTTMGASYETANFRVTAPDRETARRVAHAAEAYRRDLALAWLGRKLPLWTEPCHVEVRLDRPAPGGYTTFVFEHGDVLDWQMTVEGPLDQVLESVLPHEISHTIFATHFRRPVPRWADEGASLLAESEAERIRQRQFASQLLQSGRRIPLRQMLTLTHYPRDQRQVLALYAQGHSVAEFLILASGRGCYIAFLDSADRHGWDRAIHQHYGFESVEDLEQRFITWIEAERPPLVVPPGRLLVDAQIAAPVEAPQVASRVRVARFPLPAE